MDKKNIKNVVLHAMHNVSPYAHEKLLNIENNRDIYLVDLGINSIDYVSILYDVSNVFDIELALEDFLCTNSLTGIVDMIHNIIESKLENNEKII